jgi:hypothetical protein
MEDGRTAIMQAQTAPCSVCMPQLQGLLSLGAPEPPDELGRCVEPAHRDVGLPERHGVLPAGAFLIAKITRQNNKLVGDGRVCVGTWGAPCR